ncbi:MAG: 50S ribosomal protein L5 [Patescibacteria group bacterium]|nr:50S ribosomal protein L5 [Patescibacteria group bacterium]MDD3434907.1 50S ribosomal protein L5 [Patescibacteria group bacterium]MDD4466455.1 50S ribosomal protein L5 [Patescibacteria group bacterium]
MRLKEKYKKEIVPKLEEKFSYNNEHQVPHLSKVVINVGFGRFVKEKDYAEEVAKILEKISGQKPILTKAKKSISAFKVREGMVVGGVVSLRGQRMYDFLEKLVNITFPRVRDFRGISDKAVDRTGNLTVGFKDYSAFPEVRIEDIDKVFGLEVSIATTAKNREEGLELFRLLGFPFKK